MKFCVISLFGAENGGGHSVYVYFYKSFQEVAVDEEQNIRQSVEQVATARLSNGVFFGQLLT